MVVIARAVGFIKQQFYESICMIRSSIGVTERVAEGAAIGGVEVNSANRGSSPWLRRSRMPLRRRLEFAFGNCRSRPSACLVRLRAAGLMKSRSEVTGEDSNVAEIDAP